MFETENDTDDNTLVMAHINRKFATVKAEEEGKRASGTENVVDGMSAALINMHEGCSPFKRTKMKIIAKSILNNSHAMIAEMVTASGASEHTVKRYLKEMQEAHVLKRDYSSGESVGKGMNSIGE